LPWAITPSLPVGYAAISFTTRRRRGFHWLWAMACLAVVAAGGVVLMIR